MQKRCIALYSGGLDSILAIKIIEEQGIDVIPLFFCSPFFGCEALRDPEAFKGLHVGTYGIKTHIIDYTEDMIHILKEPHHGFGKHLNPCIDCKIGMLKRAKQLLETLNASFIITGEVLGQRPMSQRRVTMGIIEKESGLTDILLRPLSARHLAETLPERLGLVNREDLWGLSGRGRKVQIERVVSYGILKENIPTPAGGCLLTDREISLKVAGTFNRCSPALPDRADLMLDIVGRKFTLDAATVLVTGRNDEENRLMSSFVSKGNCFMKIHDVPGPLCIIRGCITKENLMLSAGICLRYGKAKGSPGHAAVYGPDPLHMESTIQAHVFSEEYLRSFQH